MNKTEKAIVFLLALALGWCFYSTYKARPAANAAPKTEAPATAAAPAKGGESGGDNAVAAAVPEKETKPAPARALPPEETVSLENDALSLVLTTHGAAVKSATLKQYAQFPGEMSPENPAVAFDYSLSPLGALKGVAAAAAFSIRSVSSNSVVFASLDGSLVRIVSLDGYQVAFEDAFASNAVPKDVYSMSLGVMAMGAGKDDMLSVDSWAVNGGKDGQAVHHADADSPLKSLLAGNPLSGGCACSAPRSAAGMPVEQSATVASPQAWIALKNRFFATALVSSSVPNGGFAATVKRDTASSSYRPHSLSAEAVVPQCADTSRRTVFFIGPKKLSLLWSLGMRDVMDFGMWRWICYPVVWLLVAFHGVAPSYGLAIILLTILVRLAFWPLTRKSTEGMKKMQELQPLMKELQAKYKDNPQRLQQETWALYRERKVNPLSSCLPMFVQIPVFIALFNVLRSAVELRYAGFLWIGDLSAPEGLFASWFPFGGLNILPLTMAGTMYLQSKLTPSAGDAAQQRMMTVFMPLMMLVMFYNFASALSLYWTVSQALSILQMWMIRRSSPAARAPVAAVAAPLETRQSRRHS